MGTGFVTPVLAAAEVTHDEWNTLLLLASVVLLGVGLLLRIRARGKSPVVVAAADPHDAIVRYRPQIYRP